LIIRDGLPLPNRCVKCAEPAATKLRKRLTWHPSALYLAIFAAVLPYLVLALILRRTLTVDLPLCAACTRKRWRNIAVLFAGFLGFVGLLVMAVLALRRHEGQATAWFAGAAIMLLFVFLWGWGIQIAMARRIDERYARLIKVGQPFLNLLPRWPYD
jgi:hypothetical protein